MRSSLILPTRSASWRCSKSHLATVLGVDAEFASQHLGGGGGGGEAKSVNNAVNDALEHQFVSGGPAAYNGKFWQERTTYNVAPQIVKNGIPALLWSGWYPTDGPGSLIEYAIFQNAYAHRPPFGPMDPDQSTTGRYRNCRWAMDARPGLG